MTMISVPNLVVRLSGAPVIPSTVNAAKATTGIMLKKNGILARSEYSAQNNNPIYSGVLASLKSKF